MHHRNAPLSVEGRRRRVERCESRPIAHVAAEMSISRACASKWVNRYRRYGDLGLHDRPSAPHRQPTATRADVVSRIEELRRTRKWSAARIAFELNGPGTPISPRTVSRHLAHLGLNRRKFIDPTGHTNRELAGSSPDAPGTWCMWTSRRSAAYPTAVAGVFMPAAVSKPRSLNAASRRASGAGTCTCIPRSMDTAASPTPKHCMTRRQPPRSVSCTGRRCGSRRTGSPISSGS